MTILDQVRTYIEEHRLFSPGENLVLGVSGGADSLCLLSIFRELSLDYGFKLHIAHLNHGLRGQEADFDTTFVIDLAWQWSIPITVQKEDISHRARQDKLSLETAARQARYTFLLEVAQAVGSTKLVLGHTQNDQAETLLMNFIRGSGILGLCGMLPLSPLQSDALEVGYELNQPILLARPLLCLSREETVNYCLAQQLTPRQDSSNEDRRYFRNRIRHDLLPYLQDYNPNIQAALSKTAQLLAADYAWLEQSYQEAWAALMLTQTPQSLVLNRSAWQELPLSVQRGTLRLSLAYLCQSLHNFSFDHIEQMFNLIQAKKSGNSIDLPHNLKLSVNYETFQIAHARFQGDQVDRPFLQPGQILKLSLPGTTPIPNSPWVVESTLQAAKTTDSSEKSKTNWAVSLDADSMGDSPILRTRQPGDIFYPLGLKGHRQRLKKFMINEKIETAYRQQVPLLVSAQGQICWVCGWRIDHRCRVTTETKRIITFTFKRL